MVQTMQHGRAQLQRHERALAAPPKPQTIIVVYEQPQVTVVRHYTKTFVPHVNPVDYEKKFNHVLLDTSTLLDLVRRLNIQEDLVRMPTATLGSVPFAVRSALDYTADDAIATSEDARQGHLLVNGNHHERTGKRMNDDSKAKLCK